MLRKAIILYRKFWGTNFENSKVNVQVTGQNASDLIKEYLLSNKPFMISRFGGNELQCLANYHFIKGSKIKNIINLLIGVPYFRKFRSHILEDMQNGAGFFPSTPENASKFSQLSINDLQHIDILASWLSHEKFFFKYFRKGFKTIHLEDLPPFNHENPWSEALAGKNVLVIHPFAKTIEKQYVKRHDLFKDKRVLPNFNLITYQSVQSIAGNSTKYSTWFEALEEMKKDISQIHFDVAILGCGAYGMPLAAHIKQIGKQAIHLGGVTQCFFGIMGKRWETPPYNYQNDFYNDWWVRPDTTEIPAKADSVEGGCYW